MNIAAGFMFGLLRGYTSAVVGMMGGATISFFLCRWVFSEGVHVRLRGNKYYEVSVMVLLWMP